jgi:hypothetical protein
LGGIGSGRPMHLLESPFVLIAVAPSREAGLPCRARDLRGGRTERCRAPPGLTCTMERTMTQADPAPITPAAPRSTQANEAPSASPLQDIEPELRALRMAASLLGHIAASPHQVDEEEIIYVQDQIIAHHARLDALWTAAWEEQGRERAAHQRALDEAKRAAAPLSEDAVKRFEALRRLLWASAQVVITECDKIDATVSSAPAVEG